MSSETTKSYYLVFHQLFHCLAVTNKEPIFFHYIHGRGVQSITVDMDTKQAAGM